MQDRSDHHLQTRAALRALEHAVIDTIKAYEAVIAGLSDETVRSEWSRIIADTERHLLEMSEVLRALGEAPPAFRSDARGLALGIVAVCAGRAGTRRALGFGERLARRLLLRYDEALAAGLPLELAAQLQSDRAEVERHRAFFRAGVPVMS